MIITRKYNHESVTVSLSYRALKIVNIISNPLLNKFCKIYGNKINFSRWITAWLKRHRQLDKVEWSGKELVLKLAVTGRDKGYISL